MGPLDFESPFLLGEIVGAEPAPRFEGQQPPPPPPAVVNLPLRGRVAIGDGTRGGIVADRIEVWVSSRDVDPPAAGAFPSARPIVPGLVAGVPTVTSMNVAGAAPTFELMVPVAVPAGGAPAVFDGFLVVRARWRHEQRGGTPRLTRVARLPIRFSSAAQQPYRVVVMHPETAPEYLWTTLDNVRPGALNRTGTATLTVKMRDEMTSRIVYRIRAACDAAGHTRVDGNVATFGVPQNKPLLVHVAPGVPGTVISLVARLADPATAVATRATIATGSAYWPRADLLVFARAQRTHAPVASSLSPTTVTLGGLAGRHLVLDPGHGLNYELTRQARVHEWFVAHRIVDKVGTAWRALGGTVTFVPTARFKTSQMRIAVDLVGVGVAEPAAAHDVTLRIDRTANPHRFSVTVDRGAFTLAALATGLGFDDAPRAGWRSLPFKPRSAFVSDYPAFFGILEARALPPAAGYAVVAGSSAWVGGSYQVTMRRAGFPDRRVVLAIARADTFALRPLEVDFLARASVLRSYTVETAPMFHPVIGNPTTPTLPGTALVDYATRVLVEREGRSPAPAGRLRFMRAAAGDAFVTNHHNADRAHGVAVLVARGTPVASPAARTAKRFLKYLDPLGNGKHGSGIKLNGSTLVTTPPSPDRYAYLETDFMDTAEPTAPGGIRYGFMVDDALFVVPAAEQIAAAVVEMLIAPQSNAALDGADIGSPE